MLYYYYVHTKKQEHMIYFYVMHDQWALRVSVWLLAINKTWKESSLVVNGVYVDQFDDCTKEEVLLT